MEQLQKGERQEGAGRGDGVPPEYDPEDEHGEDERRLHDPVEGDGTERPFGEDILCAHGRTAHRVFGALDAEGEDGQRVGDEVDPQKLRRSEEVEPPQKERRKENGEHLRKVGGKEEVDGAPHVEEHAAPLLHRTHDGGKVVAPQHHVGGVLGDVRSRSHCDADVRRLHRGRIVDAVPRHGDDLARPLQRLHDGELVPRADTRKHPEAPCLRREILAHRFELFAREHLLARAGDAQLPCDGERRSRAVPRDHHGAHARPPAFFDRLLRSLARGIEEGGKAQEIELGLFFSLGECEHAHRPARIRLRFGTDTGKERIIERPSPRRPAGGKNDVERPLFEIQRPILRGDAHAHAARLRRKRPAAREQARLSPFAAGFGVLDERHLGGIAYIASRAPADALAQPHTAEELLFSAERRDRPHRHAVLGERSRLVRADAGTASQRLHGGETADDGAEGTHALHAHREDDGDDGAHPLGNGGDRDGDGGHQVLKDARAAREDPHHKECRRHRQHRIGDDLCKAGEHFVQRGRRGLCPCQKIGDRPHLRRHARRRDEAACPPRDAERARKDGVLPLGDGARADDAVALFHGLGFPRERRFVALHALRGEDAAVGGDAVALLKFDDVSGDEQLRGEHAHPAAAHRPGRRRGELFELFESRIGAVLLHDAHRRVEHDDEEQDGGICEFGLIPRDIGEDAREDGRRDEDERHQILELRKEERGDAPPFSLLELVPAIGREAAFRLRLSEPALRGRERL